MRFIASLAFFAALVAAPASLRAQELQLASLGDVTLESGAVLRDCRVGYRTAGRRDANGSNAVLLPTWASGTSAQLMEAQVGAGKLIDPARYFVIAVDALANGVSSSPSTSTAQPRMAFPVITVGDMVRVEHLLLTRVLGLTRLHAIVGVSMGGMQAFEWLVSHPGFAERVVPIVGSPRLAPYDLLHWQAQRDAIVSDPAWLGGAYARNPARVAEASFATLLLTTPAHVNRTMTREDVEALRAKAPGETGFDANDKIRQVEAMLSMDVARGYGGSLERAAAVVRARVLVVVARHDHVVSPEPAEAFARLLGAELLVLEGECGHMAPSCEADRVGPAVGGFLARP